MSMRRRCNDPKRHNYKYYGGRGIKVCDRWDKSFLNFLEDMGERPSSIHTIDRIDNTGNYEPSNCKWSSMQEQCLNRRHKVGGSGVKGVYRSHNKWRAMIRRKNKGHYLGSFATKELAQQAVRIFTNEV